MPTHKAAFALSKEAWLPIDVGEVKALHEDVEAAGESFPPPDLDEAAGFIGRVRFLGPILGRALMLGGGLWAGYATWVAAVGIREDKDHIRALRDRIDELAAAANTAESSSASLVRGALTEVLTREVQERAFSQVANVVLLPGSALMACNLLLSAELLGHFIPVLVPLANAAMLPAVICMAVYGAIIAAKALIDICRSHATQQAIPASVKELTDPRADASPASINALRQAQAHIVQRCRLSKRWDGALAAAGAAQAIGAVLQLVIGPIWLLLLLPGTFALGLCKLGRAKQMGHGLWAPVPDTASLQTGPQHLAARLGALAKARIAMQGSPARHAAVAPWLRGRLVTALRARGEQAWADRLDVPDTQRDIGQQAADLVGALAKLDLFAPLALAVTGDVHLSPPASFRDDGSSFEVSAQEICASGAESSAALGRLYDHARTLLAGPGLFAALRDEARVAELLMQLWR